MFEKEREGGRKDGRGREDDYKNGKVIDSSF